MIVVGVELVENFKPILLAFAGLLLYSSYNLLTKDDSEEDDEDLSDNKLVKVCRYPFFLLLLRRTSTSDSFISMEDHCQDKHCSCLEFLSSPSA